MPETPEYTGSGKPPAVRPDDAWNREEPYCPEPGLKQAVNTALYLKRPLLLEGEPGAGKTRLAYAVAYELGWPLHDCYVRSTSRAEDLLYEYDQLNRLYDIQEKVFNEKKAYVTLLPLGKAVEDAAEKDRPSVVLIDEIEKADIDFPNDLLQVFEEWRFKIKEEEDGGRVIDALRGKPAKDRKHALPLVIVTSNRERDLPPAFLRRCLYYFIPFPEADTLKKILEAHSVEPVNQFFETVVNRFMDLRKTVNWVKKPGSGELIQWVEMLESALGKGEITLESLKTDRLSRLPYREIFVKNKPDLDALDSLERSA